MPQIPRDPNVAERKIYFHKAVASSGEDGDVFDRDEAVRRIAALARTADFYLAEGAPDEEQSLCAVVDRDQPPHRIRFYRVRRRLLPETEASGNFEELVLDEQRGLAESIHVVLFDDEIVGSEYNHYGPRVATFARFLRERCAIDVVLRPLVRANVIDDILAMEDIRLFRVKVAPSAVSAVRARVHGLGGAFDAAELFSAGNYMDLRLASSRDDQQFTERVKGFFRRFREAGAAIELDAAQVYGSNRDGILETLDLLHDRIVLTREIARAAPRSRALDQDDAYRAVEAGHAEISDELGEAGTIVPE